MVADDVGGLGVSRGPDGVTGAGGGAVLAGLLGEVALTHWAGCGHAGGFGRTRGVCLSCGLRRGRLGKEAWSAERQGRAARGCEACGFQAPRLWLGHQGFLAPQITESTGPPLPTSSAPARAFPGGSDAGPWSRSRAL